MAKCVLIIFILATLSFPVYCGSNKEQMMKQEFQLLCNNFNKTGEFEFVNELFQVDDCWQKILSSDMYARFVKCGDKLNYTTADQVSKFCSNIDASIGLVKEATKCLKDLITPEFQEKFTKCLEQKMSTKNVDKSIQISK